MFNPSLDEILEPRLKIRERNISSKIRVLLALFGQMPKNKGAKKLGNIRYIVCTCLHRHSTHKEYIYSINSIVKFNAYLI